MANKDSDKRASRSSESGVMRTEPQPEPAVDKSEEVTAPVVELPVTAERFFIASKADPIVMAFLHAEKLRGGGIRKLGRAKWKEEFEAFKAAERR